MGTVSRPEMATLSSQPTSRVNNYQKIDIASLWKKRGTLFTVASVILMFTSGIFGAQAAAVAAPKPVCPTQQPLVPFQDRISVCFHPEEYINQIPHDLEQLGSLIPPVRGEIERAIEREWTQDEKDKKEIRLVRDRLDKLAKQEEKYKREESSFTIAEMLKLIPSVESLSPGMAHPFVLIPNPLQLLPDFLVSLIDRINHLQAKIDTSYSMGVYKLIQDRTRWEKIISITEEAIKGHERAFSLLEEEISAFKSHTYQLPGGALIHDQTNGVAKALFWEEETQNIRKYYPGESAYKVLIQNKPVTLPGAKFSSFSGIQELKLNFFQNHFIQISEKDLKGNSASYYVDLRKREKEIFVAYPYLPQEVTEADARWRIENLRKDFPDLKPNVVVYNRHGVAAAAFLHSAFYWANPNEEKMRKIGVEFTQWRDGGSFFIRAKDGSVVLQYTVSNLWRELPFGGAKLGDKIYYLNREPATKLSII